MNWILSIVLVIGAFLGKSQDLDSTKVFTSLEDALKTPEQILILDLSKQKLNQIPEEIGRLSNLQELNLRKNKLSELPEALSRLKKLETLNISRNQFETFPTVICQLSSLVHLSIGSNEIDGFPTCIGSLKKLEYLDGNSNNLGIFPHELSGLVSLKELDLRVISLSDDEQQKIISLLPSTCKIRFSNSCNCGF